ncbi:hypothetical protein SAMN05192529_104168 [Arachidicoccus rhizosphaerae]|uniref:Uncharacterized protein n=1 Tax=Arachidicoccus rhizosphaerae TaxID=551991 RepID=A0A1H3X541_9BACT|nr:hypothetical protein [Arachidicoccus rhizosphaerae]SDZ93648.1 hypothetical protein SAMN05192529_104168 [Arachidicoccus rhizosphaerae]
MQTCIPLNEKTVTTVFLLGLIILLFFAGCAVVKTNYSSDIAKDATVYYYLPETLLNIHVTAKVAVVYTKKDSVLTPYSRVLSERFELMPEMIADTRELLSLNYKPNALMTDSIKYAVNAKGLLETVNVVTEDKTAAIVEAIAQGSEVILPLSDADKKNWAGDQPILAGSFVKIKDFTDTIAIKVSELSQVPKEVHWNLVLENEVKPEALPATLAANFNISSDNLSKLPRAVSRPGIDTTIGYLLTKRDSNRREVKGILTRPLKNITVKISPISESKPDQIQSQTSYVTIADPGKLIVIPIKRTAFVRQTNNVTIADGVVLSNSIYKPSSVEGFISIPINIAKSIVSIPAQLIQFRIDNTKRSTTLENEKLNYEKSLLQNQMYTLQKGLQMDSLQLEIQKADIRSQQALEKLKAELQTSLSTAQIAQLQTQHQLDSLKQVIDSLTTQN